MLKKAVILIQGDPRQSHRPCEGIRIALGLASSRHRVELIFTGEASRILEDGNEDLVDEELALKYLSALKMYTPVLYIDEAGAHGIDLSVCDYNTRPLSRDEIASKIADSDWFARF